jgi:hypothetical protein
MGASVRTPHAPIVTGAHYNGARHRRRSAPLADQPDRPRGVRGFRSLGLVLVWSKTVKARRCDDIILFIGRSR